MSSKSKSKLYHDAIVKAVRAGAVPGCGYEELSVYTIAGKYPTNKEFEIFGAVYGAALEAFQKLFAVAHPKYIEAVAAGVVSDCEVRRIYDDEGGAAFMDNFDF